MSREARRKMISLSTSGLKHLEHLAIPKDFEFIVGKERYPTFKLVACYLSPNVIGHMMKSDPTMSEFTVPIADPNHYFQTIMDIIYEHPYEISKENFLFVRKVGEIFQNDMLIRTGTIPELLIPSDENCLSIAKKMYEVEDSSLGDFISYITTNFEVIASQAELRNLPLDLYMRIMEHHDFHFTKKTYNILKHILDERPEFMPIFKKTVFANFQHLTQEDLQDFTGHINDDDFPEAAEVVRAAVSRAAPI